MEKYHLVGIKGAGMSALANILHDIGKDVQGSDVETHYFTQELLEDKGVSLLPFNAENIEKEHIVIAGNAYKDDHPEIQAAKIKGNPVFRYHQVLGAMISESTSVAISGAHGKTSTTGLASHVLKSIFPTTYLIGDGTGVGEKDAKYFVFEACEYKRHFLAYKPDYAIITNIDFDHPDYFKDLEDVKESFETFAAQAKKAVIGCGDDENVREMARRNEIFTYGLEKNNMLQAQRIKTTDEGTSFEGVLDGESLGKFFIPLFGNHHVSNALAVVAVCLLEGISMEEAKKHFATYDGVKRRFHVEEFNGNIVIDDYAHHPTEIKATIESVRVKYPNKECVVVFQPHTYTRTKQFLREFASALAMADKIYLCDIFSSAREQEGHISIFDLINLTPRSNYLTKENIEYHLSPCEGKVILFMGAGDIQKYIEVYKESALLSL